MPGSEITQSSPRFLVVDDEIVGQSEKEDFEDDTSLPVESGIFVQTYEEALEVLQSNLNIVLCCIDIKIPRNKQDIYEKDEREFETWKEHIEKKVIDIKNEYGVRLLQQITTDTIIFSAYADLDSLRQEAEQYPYVIDYYKKPFISQDFRKIKTYSGLFQQKKAISTLSKSFDYSLLDDDTISFVQSRTIKIKRLAKRVAADVINVGNYLIEVKNKLGHGYFMDWLEAEFNWSNRTAARFMSVAQKFTIDSLTNLELLPTALYIMAAPSTPNEAVVEVMERAKQGETITEKKAKEIKDRHKALKEQTRAEVQFQNINQESENSRAKKKEDILTIAHAPQKPPSLPENKIKQKILSVVPSPNAVKNSWWKLGEHHRLFCGEPKSQEFIKRLPQENIGLSITFLPDNDFSLIPSIEAIVACIFHLKDEDTDLDSVIKPLIEKTTQPDEIIVFNYLYYIDLLDLTEQLGCHFIVAEPDLEKCEHILTMWREKGSVERIKY